jgi:hypothetical protein
MTHPLIPLAPDDPLEDFSEATIKALEVLDLQVQCLKLSRTWEELNGDVFRVCEAAHAITHSINRAYRARTNEPFIGHTPQLITPHRTTSPKPPAQRPSLSSLGDLL